MCSHSFSYIFLMLSALLFFAPLPLLYLFFYPTCPSAQTHQDLRIRGIPTLTTACCTKFTIRRRGVHIVAMISSDDNKNAKKNQQRESTLSATDTMTLYYTLFNFSPPNSITPIQLSRHQNICILVFTGTPFYLLLFWENTHSRFFARGCDC
ncbi:hypothetical protein BJV82DRAFT_164607 [Fennellomyces sp. T-0311]|nr:hypothetical protein BJV82DRAFT_164607 [Fennellomyces sp. T-0311]